MLRIALVGIFLQVVLCTGTAEAICCDDIRSDVDNRTLAYNVLCSKNDPHLRNCCRVIEQDIRKHELSYRTLCPDHEINYCSSNPCHRNATCISHPDSFSCTCKTGFTGSGLVCSVINYCSSSPCHHNATCISHPDSFSCTCKTGFTGSGLVCSDINECLHQQCGVNAVCNNTLGSFSCSCKTGYFGDGINCTAFKSCADLYKSGVAQDGVYIINPDGLGSFQVRCDMTTNGGGWTVFQRRQDGSEDFYLGWSDYKAGFGDLNGEFWLGLDKIHRLTKSGQDVLRVDLMDFSNTQRYAEYGTFSVADESDKYRLSFGQYSGDAGDPLDYHNNMQFSTKNSDNDIRSSESCAVTYKGAWWYKSCYKSNLNGLYLGAGQTAYTGIQWQTINGYSLKKTEMKTRPSQF